MAKIADLVTAAVVSMTARQATDAAIDAEEDEG
jgi:hypothetical protein